MDQQQGTDTDSTLTPQPAVAADSAPVRRKTNPLSIIVLVLILLAVPASVIYLGQKTRQEIKAANDCKTPPIPDPSDCAGGDWKIYKNAEGCVRFRCIPR